jgi:hypothetical protein
MVGIGRGVWFVFAGVDFVVFGRAGGAVFVVPDSLAFVSAGGADGTAGVVAAGDSDPGRGAVTVMVSVVVAARPPSSCAPIRRTCTPKSFGCGVQETRSPTISMLEVLTPVKSSVMPYQGSTNPSDETLNVTG